MHLRLSVLASQLLSDRECFFRTHRCPVLVWESAPASLLAVHRMTTTLPSYRPEGRVSPEPFIYEVRPGLRLTGAAENAEVALGRDPRCDIVLPDPTVSRLHARLRPEPHTGVWTVTDAESHNGTFQDGVLIVPGRPSPLFGRALLRLGHAELLFLQPAALKDYVLARALPPPVRLTRRG